jgi:hypothetical protein
MLTDSFAKKPFFNDQVADIFYSAGAGILNKQRYLLRTFFSRRSGATERMLSGRNFNVMASSARVQLIINYISTIRFLDLKKTAKGGKKRNYVSIYNKILYGYLYGKTYPALRYGMVSNIKENYTGTLRAGLSAKGE